MLGAIILFCLSAAAFFVGYQSIRYKRTFWFAPTITGFNKRKKKENMFISLLIGITITLLGIFFLFLSVKSILHYFYH